MAEMPGGTTTRHLADGNSPNSLSRFHWLDKHSTEAGRNVPSSSTGTLYMSSGIVWM